MSSYELYHFGIKGMKWGIRRYQNDDGTYTEAGLERRRKAIDDNAFRGILKKEADSYKAQADNALSIGREGVNVGRAVNSMHSRRQQRKLDALKEKREAELDEELKNMDDKTLQQAVNRLNMERNYKNLKTADIKAGRSLVDDVLDDAGSVLAIGASAATIALAIYQIRGNSWK